MTLSNSKIGFTLIELLIVIGITVIVVAAGASIYSHVLVSTELDETTAQLVQNLRLARQQSQTGLNNAPHGVQFQAHQYIIYQGASYVMRDMSYDRTIGVGSAITLSATMTGGDVHFSTGLGVPNNPDSVGTITVTHAVSGSRTVNVNSLGVVTE